MDSQGEENKEPEKGNQPVSQQISENKEEETERLLVDIEEHPPKHKTLVDNQSERISLGLMESTTGVHRETIMYSPKLDVKIH
jgi:hypothetical protein